MTKWKSAAYMDTMQELIPFTAGDIVYNGPCVKTKKQDIYHEQLLT